MKQNLFILMLIMASVFSFSSCSSDDEGNSGLSEKEVSLKVGQSMTLSYGGGECTWSSDQPLIAEVDNNGNVTANRVGITNIKANGEICKVTVNPNYTTYEEPYLNFGASMNEVKNAMSGYTLSSKTDANNLVYIGKNVIDYYDYMFKNNGLYAVILATDIFKGKETSNFLAERYIVVSVDKNKNQVLLTSIDMEIAVMIQINDKTGAILIMYASAKDTKSISNKSLDMVDVNQCSKNINLSKEIELFMNSFNPSN
nr:Ig-like domain-containing protein [Bacteroides intestinalis]